MKKTTSQRSSKNVDDEEVEALLYETLETELGGVEIYRTALHCAQNEDLRDEWEKYLEQTQRHVHRVRELCAQLGLDPDTDTPGRQVVRFRGKALVRSMLLALGGDNPTSAERVAAECVTLAETRDHLNWSLLGEWAREARGAAAELVARAHAEIEPEEDEHLYHTQGWTRELWKRALGLPAQLPPPEQTEDVRSPLEAAHAKRSPAQEAFP